MAAHLEPPLFQLLQLAHAGLAGVIVFRLGPQLAAVLAVQLVALLLLLLFKPRCQSKKKKKKKKKWCMSKKKN